MRPSHIALFNVPLHGHVNPTLAIVAELVRRGHRVSYAVTADFAPQVAAAGATPVTYESLLPRADRGEEWPHHDPTAMASLFLAEAAAILPGQRAAFEADRPDLVLYDFTAHSARMLARRWGVPAVRLSPTHVPGASYEAQRELVQEMMADDPEWIAYRRRFQLFLARGGVPMSIDDYVGQPELCVVTIPREFQTEADTVDDRYIFVGPCISDRGFQGEWAGPADGRPVLLVSLGSVLSNADLYRECAAAFAGTPWQVVLVVGPQLDPAVLGPLPGNVEVHRSVPQLSVLGRAAAFVTHAGMGSVMEALHHGVPMVAVPQSADQPMNARRIEELGLGRMLDPGQARAAELRKAVEEVAADPGTAERLREMKESLRRMAGPAAAADLIERQLTAAAGPDDTPPPRGGGPSYL